MISDIHPAPMGLRPLASAVSAANAAANESANRPSPEDIRALAGHLRQGLPGGYASAPASLPGLGGHLDLYDTVVKPGPGLPGGERPTENPFQALGGDFDQGLAGFEPMETPHDFPYLKPLADGNLGNRLNTLV